MRPNGPFFQMSLSYFASGIWPLSLRFLEPGRPDVDLLLLDPLDYDTCRRGTNYYLLCVAESLKSDFPQTSTNYTVVFSATQHGGRVRPIEYIIYFVIQFWNDAIGHFRC